ncbi:hypothetical protein CRENBAI_003083 [Crenichthys baileyi]|uniref:Fibronectin type-III domain-containing protein n=1 Tax=Crenichthys baileyi TaxID=28760 RepID=A0AAV9RNM0_9TELE
MSEDFYADFNSEEEVRRNVVPEQQLGDLTTLHPAQRFKKLCTLSTCSSPAVPLSSMLREHLMELPHHSSSESVHLQFLRLLCELHLRSSCPPPPQPIPSACTEGPTEICFFGKKWSYNVTGLQPYSTYELSVACFNNMGSTASNWTAVSTLGEPPQYVSPFSVDSNLTVIWLDWTGTFSLNGYLKEYTVTESQLRVYTGFYSYLHIPRTSQKTLSFQVTCITDSGSASTPTIRYSPATGLGPLEPVDGDKQGVSISATPVYSELWFILLFALLGLFLLAILIGLLLKRALRKNPSARERPPLVMLQKTRKPGGDVYMGLTDTKIVGSSSRYSPMSVLRAPSQTDLTQAYSQHSLHRSVSQLIDRKSLMMEEGCWDNPLGHDSGLYVEEDEFVDAIKAISSGKKEHTNFTDTHLGHLGKFKINKLAVTTEAPPAQGRQSDKGTSEAFAAAFTAIVSHRGRGEAVKKRVCGVIRLQSSKRPSRVRVPDPEAFAECLPPLSPPISCLPTVGKI